LDIQLNHLYDNAIEYRVAGCLLFRLVYQPRVPHLESPKPYIHPLSTLRGNCVTIHRPHDHLWHHGLAMTCPELSGQNFWGGPTYVRDEGYRQLANNGAQRHVAWRAVRLEEGLARLEEALVWVTAGGELWLEEERTWHVARIAPDQGCWELAFATRLSNASGRTLAFGSPTTAGRPAAGYGGLFWRGPRSFTGGRILLADGTEGEEAVMGRRAPWLAYTGAHDGTAERSTLVFIDDPGNPRYPTQWFARNGYGAMASFAFAFDEVYELPAREVLELSYRVIVADGAWSADRIAEAVGPA
jgi:hypothetical protein